jgi:hypothetical protein
MRLLLGGFFPAARLVGLDYRLQVDAVDDRSDVQRAVPLTFHVLVRARNMLPARVTPSGSVALIARRNAAAMAYRSQVAGSTPRASST